MSDMKDITIAQAVETCLRMPSNIPIMFWGEPGLGKTKTIQSKFEELKYNVISVLAGQSEPTDIQGIPFPNEETKAYCDYLIPWWGFLASNHPAVPKEFKGDMVLFFDDLVTAHEQTQAAFYKLVDEKHLGQWSIRDNVRIIAAGNRVDDMSAVTDMPKALCNRFMHFYVRPNLDVWLDWAPKAGVHPHVIFYHRKMKSNAKLSTFKDNIDSTTVHAWATPRTWEMLSDALHSLDEAQLRGKDYGGNDDYEFNVVQGCIGKLALEFITTIKDDYNIIPPEEIVKGISESKIPGLDNVDRLYATVSNLEHWFTDVEHHKYWEPVLKFAMQVPDEFGLLLAKHFFTIMTDDMESKLRDAALASGTFEDIIDKWDDKLNIII
jgi:hypothetical protein